MGRPNNNNYRNGNRNNDYNNNGGYNNRSNNGGGQDSPQKKRSGAKRGQTKDGKSFISAWNYSRSRGLLTALAYPYHSTSETESNSGKKWQNWMVKLQWKRSGQEKNIPCLFCVTDGRVHINSEGMIINPSKNYFGTKFRRD